MEVPLEALDSVRSYSFGRHRLDSLNDGRFT